MANKKNPKGVSMEQLEAHQEALNKKNAELFKTHTPEAQKKILALRKATELLIKAKVPTYLHGLVEIGGTGERKIISYNTMPALMKETPSGFLTKESKITNHLINTGMSASVVDMYMNEISRSGEESYTPQQAINIILLCWMIWSNQTEDTTLKDLQALDE